MYTQCPQCLTFFQVTPEHLRIAQGNVRCGQCRNVFSALGNLTEEPPEVAYEDQETDLEDEIFIDEGELEDFAEEYPEEFYIAEEHIADEEKEQELPQIASAGSSVDAKATTSTKASPTPPQNRAITHNSKLSEAIATIEKLKRSYSNLSFRQLEQSQATPGVASPPLVSEAKPRAVINGNEIKPNTTPPPAPSDPSEHGNKFENRDEQRDEVHAPATHQKVSSAPSNSADIAIQRYPQDDNVDYEEALNALSELKIIEENEDVLGEDALSEALGEVSETKDQGQSTVVVQEPVHFNDDLSIDENELLDEKHNHISVDREDFSVDREDFDSPTHESNKANQFEVKVKSLDRRANEASTKSVETTAKTPAEPGPARTTTLDHDESKPKYLPAIPKQLLEDFHPNHQLEERPHFATYAWSAGSILLMLFFLVQTVYFKHNDLARQPQLRPWIERFCGYLSCDLSLPSDVRQLELVSQDIRSHPKVKSALLVTTTIINNAYFTQSYPGLQITFSDLNGQRVAMRRFAPQEYLSKDTLQEAGMPPNTPIQVELEMMDPGSNAVNFEFDFIPLS